MTRPLAAALLLAIAALLVPAIRHLREAAPPLPPAVRLSLAAPAGTELGGGDEPLDAAISPDQREVVFVATRLRRAAPDQSPAGSTQLWRRRLDAEDATALAGTDGASLPAWKQTGNVIAFFADGRLKLLNLRSGGAVTDAAEATAPAGATWLRDGSLLFVPSNGPIRRLLNGQVTDATKLAAGETAHLFPASTAGDGFTYVVVRSDGKRIARLHANGQDTDLASTTAHAAVPDPRWVLFVKGGALLADVRDEGGGLGGTDLPLALDVGTTPRGRGLFVASPDLLLHAKSAERPRQIVWLDMRGAAVGTVADVGDYWQVRLSPDDGNVAVTARDALLQSLDVLMIPAATSAPGLRLTTSVAADTDPVWAPDGRQLAFRTMQRGRPEIFVTSAGIREPNQGGETATPAKAAGEVPTAWHGSELLVQRRGNAGFDLVRVHDTTGNATPVADSPFNETDGRWSPDGRWIAYVSDEPGRPDIYVQTTGGERQRVSLGGGTSPRWTRDSRSILFLRGSALMRTDLNATGRFESPHAIAQLPGVRDFDVSRRTDRIVALMPVMTDGVNSVSAILNWRSLAERQRQLTQKKAVPKF